MADIAYTAGSNCYIAVSRLDMDVLTNSDQVILGASFLQQFNALFWYNYTAGTQTLTLTKSGNNTLQGSYIGNYNYTVGAPMSGFYQQEPFSIPLKLDSTYMTATIDANFGFNGKGRFQVNPQAQQAMTFSNDCSVNMKWGHHWQFTNSCEDYPLQATNYYNNSFFLNSTNNYHYGPAAYSGYNVSGYGFNTTACLYMQVSGTFYPVCDLFANEVYSVNSVTGVNWNPFNPSYSGVVGFGSGSPVWGILNWPSTKQFDIMMTNFKSYSWINSTYSAYTTSPVLNFGQYGNYDFASNENTTKV